MLQQMTLLTQMREGFETEGVPRKEDCKNLEEKMAAEGSKKEQHTRQHIRSEIVQGFTNEQNTRQLF